MTMLCTLIRGQMSYTFFSGGGGDYVLVVKFSGGGGIYVHVYKNEQGGFCPGGIMSVSRGAHVLLCQLLGGRCPHMPFS